MMTDERFQELLEALNAVAEDHVCDLPEGDEPMAQAIRKIAQRRQVEAISRLDRVVNNTIEVNELAIARASILVSSENISRSSQTVATTSEELSASVASINHSVEGCQALSVEVRGTTAGSRQKMGTAIVATEKSRESMQTVTKRSHSLADAANNIANAIKTIDSIAMQTNLLALNASVEAARAGEAGRGFAVVAQEVRSLSDQTKSATVRISEAVRTLESEVAAIAKSVKAAEGATSQARTHLEDLGQDMETVVGDIVQLDDQLGNIARAVSEQARAATDLSRAASDTSTLADVNTEAMHISEEALEKLVGLTGRELSAVSQIDAPHKIVRLAKADHVIWKKRLSDMFAGRLKLNPDELSNHQVCRLGKWYYGPEAVPLRSHPAFVALENPHAEVHRAGISAAKSYNDNRHEQALAHMRDVETASAEVLRLLTELTVAGDQMQHAPRTDTTARPAIAQRAAQAHTGH